MTTKTRKITVDEFWEMAADSGHRCAWVDGVLVYMDGTPKHVLVSTQCSRLMADHVFDADLSLHVGSFTECKITPNTLRFPDVKAITAERMAQHDESADAWPKFATSIAIEAVSPSNTPAALARTTEEYFANGAQAVWIADRAPRTGVIGRPGVAEQVFGAGETLNGEPEIPVYTCTAEIFAVLDRMPRSGAGGS